MEKTQDYPKKGAFSRFIEYLSVKKEQRTIKKSQTYQQEPQVEHFKVSKKNEGSFELFNKRLNEDSLIALIIGKRGSGKSALGFKIMENVHGKTRRKCYALGIGQKHMPKWISPLDKVEEAENGSIILVDEGAVDFSSRESMKSKNKELGKLLSIARHKNMTLIFIAQNSGMIDKNILNLTDALFIKEGSLLQLQMERPEIRKFYEKANEAFSKSEGLQNKYAYLIDSDFEGSIEHSLPSFWSDRLSKNQSA